MSLACIYCNFMHSYFLMYTVICIWCFISNTFITKPGWNWNQANAKQHPEIELLLFENYSHSSSRYHPKIIEQILKNKQKNKCVCFHEIIRLIILKMEMKMKNKSHRYDINRPRPRYGHKYSKYRKCLSIMMLFCIKQ